MTAAAPSLVSSWRGRLPSRLLTPSACSSGVGPASRNRLSSVWILTRALSRLAELTLGGIVQAPRPFPGFGALARPIAEVRLGGRGCLIKSDITHNNQGRLVGAVPSSEEGGEIVTSGGADGFSVPNGQAVVWVRSGISKLAPGS